MTVEPKIIANDLLMGQNYCLVLAVIAKITGENLIIVLVIHEETDVKTSILPSVLLIV